MTDLKKNRQTDVKHWQKKKFKKQREVNCRVFSRQREHKTLTYIQTICCKEEKKERKRNKDVQKDKDR